MLTASSTLGATTTWFAAHAGTLALQPTNPSAVRTSFGNRPADDAEQDPITDDWHLTARERASKNVMGNGIGQVTASVQPMSKLPEGS
jgi:hypothetical protein